MKAYFLTETQIARIVDYARSSEFDSYKRYGCVYQETDSDITKRITKDLDDITPIEIDDATIGEIDVPCKFYPKASIVGFSKNDGYLKGVFVKE